MIERVNLSDARMIRLAFLWLVGLCAGHRLDAAAPQLQVPQEDYNQWKEALGTNAATAAAHIQALEGFVVELVRSAAPNEGSWVAMTFDPLGRVVIAREDRGLLRLHPPSATEPGGRIEMINTNLLECRGLLFAHGALYANANNSKGLYRLRDANGDGQFEEITLLRQTPGGVGHGRNQLALGPDGWIYSIHGDDVGLPEGGADPGSAFGHYGEDQLSLPVWDKHLFGPGVRVPAGHLIRTDPNGRRWELVAGGLRNPYGIAFNADGEMFTFDADMEWDVGLPWYRPTRVLHIVSGGDYGWRRGTGVIPSWAPDTLPSVLDIGLSSPTAVQFGYKSHFPAPYRDALFILDWSYGRVLAVHLNPVQSSYAGRYETFLKGRPLNVTSLDFGPDGALYFVTGGRRTQSGLYRVRASDPQLTAVTPPPRDEAAARARELRRKLEAARGQADPATVELAWNALRHEDRWIQYAARVLLESVPTSLWAEQALARSNGSNGSAVPAPMPDCLALLALARVGESSLQPRVREQLIRLLEGSIDAAARLVALRALKVSFARHGRPEPSLAAAWAARLQKGYPADDAHSNLLWCEVLLHLGSPDAVRKTIPLLTSSSSQEDTIQYLYLLRTAATGWTLENRRTYFEVLRRARSDFQGANMLPTILNYIRADAVGALNPDERLALGSLLNSLVKPAAAAAAPAMAPTARPVVRQWAMQHFFGLLDLSARASDLSRGQRLFQETGCLQCHRFGRDGGLAGPDLTDVARRFDRRTLLESILEPSKVIADTYRAMSFTLKSGAIIDGRIMGEDDSSIDVAINPVDPDQRRRIAKSELESQRVSDVSPMPANLLDTLTLAEILDLLAFLESGANVQAASNSAAGASPK